MTYRPAAVSQLDGSAFETQNCMAAVACMILDRDTRGARTTTPAHVRSLTGDRSGGLTFPQDDAALKLIDGRDHLDFEPKLSFGAFCARLDAGEGAGVIVDYGVVVDAGWNGNQSSGFRDAHGWYSNQRRQASIGWEHLIFDPLQDGRRPGIPTSPRWVPEWVVRRAAGVYAGTGYVQAGFTRDTEIQRRVRFLPGDLAWIYSVDAKGDFLAGDAWRKAKRFLVATGAPCDAPEWVTGGGHPGKSLVRVSAGYLTGKYIERKFVVEVA